MTLLWQYSIPTGSKIEPYCTRLPMQRTTPSSLLLVQLLEPAVLAPLFCQRRFRVSGPAIYADFQTLIRLRNAKRVGAGQATRYVLAAPSESLINH